jgi:hypothetical protein
VSCNALVDGVLFERGSCIPSLLRIVFKQKIRSCLQPDCRLAACAVLHLSMREAAASDPKEVVDSGISGPWVVAMSVFTCLRMAGHSSDILKCHQWLRPTALWQAAAAASLSSRSPETLKVAHTYCVQDAHSHYCSAMRRLRWGPWQSQRGSASWLMRPWKWVPSVV